MTPGEAGPAQATAAPPRMTDVGVLDKTAAILRLLMTSSMTAGEICEAVGLSRSTGYRLLAALVSHGFIVRTAAGHFVLGPFPQRDALAEVTAILTSLRDRTGESAQLWMLHGDMRACVASVDSKHDLRISKSAGTALPLRDGGSGALALLASGSPSELFITRGGRKEGIGSASIAFDGDAGQRLALCASFPLARVTGDASRIFSAPLADAVRVLMPIVQESGVCDSLRTIAESARVER